jgi:hypothetical protein
MRKGFSPIFIILIIAAVAGIGLVSYQVIKKNNSQGQQETNNNTKQTAVNIFQDQPNLCISISQATVGELLGKTIIKTESLSSGSLASCQYYLDNTHALVLNHDHSSINSKIKGHEFLERTVSSDNSIPMKNYVVIQKDGLINEIYLVFSDNEFVSINRPNGKLISEEEIMSFAQKLAIFFTNGEPDTAPTTHNKTKDSIVPKPQETNIINNFFSLIDNKDIPAAISMMSTTAVKDNSAKQAWGVQFNNIKSINVLQIEPSMPENWTPDRHIYKVTLEAYVSSDSANAPIPYYGWGDNPNIRWVELVKENNLWKINALATSP